MSLVSFANRTVTVIRPTRVKDHGSWHDDWTSPEPDRDIEGCVVFPGVSDEESGRADAEKVLFTVLAPEGSDVTSRDRVRTDLAPGLDLAVFGRPKNIPSPTGRLACLQIELADWRAT